MYVANAWAQGSDIEVLVADGTMEIFVKHVADAQELVWQNTRTVPKPYK